MHKAPTIVEKISEVLFSGKNKMGQTELVSLLENRASMDLF